MSAAKQPHAQPARLATLLEIGRTLMGSTDPTELRSAIAASLSRLFPGDLLFCADVDDNGRARVVALAQDGVHRRADATYTTLSDAATPENGCVVARAAATEVGRALATRRAVVSAVGVPVRMGTRITGEIGALRFAGRPFDDDDCEVLAFGATIVAVANTQRERVEETETRRREAERLEQIGRAITASLDLEEVLERVMQAVLDLTNADSCTIWRREGERAVVVASRGPDAYPVGFDVDVADEIRADLLANRRSIQIPDVSADRRISAAARARLAGDGPHSVILLPMQSHDTVVGVLAVAHHEPQRYGEEAMRILERLALQAAIAVENARLHAEIRDLSLTDPLTGLPNRRQMEMVLSKEFEAARRGRPLTIVLFDVDDFKRYNDSHGHTAGDAALRDFAAALSAETRAMNLAARYGGDEFLTILSETRADGAAHLVQRIEKRVRANPRLEGIGFSAGIAEYSKEMTTPVQLIEAADAAMYRDKARARATQ